MSEEYVGLLAAFAVAQGASHEAAWLTAKAVADEIPGDLVAASAEVMRRAALEVWTNS